MLFKMLEPDDPNFGLYCVSEDGTTPLTGMLTLDQIEDWLSMLPDPIGE